MAPHVPLALLLLSARSLMAQETLRGTAERPAAPPPTAPPTDDDGGSSKSQALGFTGVVIAAVGFGSNFVVIKKYDPGDGLFFQFCMCVGVFLTGLLYHIAKDVPPLQVPAMLGGVLWATGNVMYPFMIDSIGIGLGLSISGATNMLAGWGSATIGVFGMTKQTVTHTGLNVAGAMVAVVSIVVYAQVETQTERPAAGGDSDGDGSPREGSLNQKEGSLDQDTRRRRIGTASTASAGPAAFAGAGEKQAPKSRARIVTGIIVAMLSGIFQGVCFDPVQAVSDHAASHHCNAVATLDACHKVLENHGRIYCKWDSSADKGEKCGGMPIPDMAFSQFCGILLTSWVYFVVYWAWKAVAWSREHPESTLGAAFAGAQGSYFNTELTVPAMLSGIIWAIAQIGWFIANDNLSITIAFPIICSAPTIIGNAWGFFVFDELVRTPRNLATLLFAIALTVIAGALTAASQ